MGEMTLQVAQPLGPACGCRRNPGQALGEGLAGTGGVEAAESPCLDGLDPTVMLVANSVSSYAAA